MPDARPIGTLARRRVRSSSEPLRFRTCMARTLAELDRGEDLATAVWTPVDPVKTAAEIEALAGVRRINMPRRDAK